MFNKNIYKLGVFIDLSKAFGTADHNILLKQLSNYGIKNQTLDWYIYYLSNRKKFIGYNVNSKNNFFDVICGAQKGSFLGPVFSSKNIFLMASPINFSFLFKAFL